MKKVLIMLLMFGLSQTDGYSSFLFKRIRDFEKKQGTMMERTKKFEDYINKKSESKVDETAVEQEFEDRLSRLEKRITTLMNYLTREKVADMDLKKEAKNTITEMKGKVQQSDNLIIELENQVQDSLLKFDDKINKVNKTAHLTVNVKGVVFIGSIGSSCSKEAGDCNLPNAECRDGKCQCQMGLSFENELNECVESCKEYGCTFQSARRRIIREYNEKILENTTLSDCKTSCIEEKNFLCLSFDYFPRWETCYLSAQTKKDVPDENWEYNSAGSHFQRDCLGIKEISLCHGNEP